MNQDSSQPSTTPSVISFILELYLAHLDLDKELKIKTRGSI
tara:strand:+ start:461 stop:583 length:123 start_codon:yes stop_codon:yes gene_type:complete